MKFKITLKAIAKSHTLIRGLIAAYAAFGAVYLSEAAEPLCWERTPNRPAPAQFDTFHGQSLDFRCTFSGFGALPFAAGEDVRLWYQTNGMGAAWWSIPATVSSNALFATFPPGADPGAERLSVFFGAPSNAYAAAQVRFRNSPGAHPNDLEPPSVLDWQAELSSATNALATNVYTKKETDAKIVELSPTPDMSGVVHGDDRAADKDEFEAGLKFRMADADGGNMRLRIEDPNDNGISWYSQSSGTTLGSPFFRVNASGIRHPTERATPYKLSTWDEITRAHSILEYMPTYTGQTGNNYDFPVSAGAVLNWFWNLTNLPTGAIESIRNDVTNIVNKAYVESLGIESGVSEATVTNVVRSVAYAVNDYVWDGDVCWRRQMLQGGYLEYVAVTNIDVTLPGNYKALEALEKARRNQE